MRYILLLLFFYHSGISYSQNSKEKFSLEVIKFPNENKSVLDNSFHYSEIDTYNLNSSDTVVFLENGYAQFDLNDINGWKRIRKNIKVNRISIIYTKYPFKKSDWITNYYFLLGKRLEALFFLDPTLNVKSIDWNLVAQTNCNTGETAEKMLHGIEIKFSIIDISAEKNNIITKETSQIERIEEYRSYENKSFIKEFEKSFEEESRIYRKDKEKKKVKEPECPDFSKKKIFRLFKKRK